MITNFIKLYSHWQCFQFLNASTLATTHTALAMPAMGEAIRLELGVQYPTEDNLEAVWAEISTLS